jgi:predicted PhzF superfamily epimerase YddE/YHI9
MTTLHVLRVFIGPDGRGGNPLGVFLEGLEIEPDRRQAVAAELNYSETVWVDTIADGVARVRIFTPAVELPFAGHPTVGTSWLLRDVGEDVTTLRCPAGDVEAWQDGDLAWVRARAEWVRGVPAPDHLATPQDVDAVVPPSMGEPGRYVWAWDDEAAGRVRARFFPTDLGIAEDEATGAAAVVMGTLLRRPITIRQGVGSEIHAVPAEDGTVAVGGLVELVEHRAYGA